VKQNEGSRLKAAADFLGKGQETLTMGAVNKRSIKQALAAIAAGAVLGLAAAPAHALLEWRVDGGVGQKFVICDLGGVGVCTVPAGFVLVVGGDLNPSAEVITVNTTALNILLTGKFDFTSAGADDNILAATTLAVINSSAQVVINTNGGGSQTLIIEATRDGWLIPLTNPRTLTNGPSATLTNTNNGSGGSVASTGFNDGNNILFGTQFATPTSIFVAGAAPCGAVVGGVSTCSALTQLAGINEPNPYSLTNRQTITSGGGNGEAVYLVTDSSTKFGPQQQVPEPASLLLLGAGLAALGFARRRKNA
jgi:hypothetical protein